MKVTVANSAGFCFGVKRAVQMVYDEAEGMSCPIYTYGPIIHNDEVVKDMEKKLQRNYFSSEKVRFNDEEDVVLIGHCILLSVIVVLLISLTVHNYSNKKG